MFWSMVLPFKITSYLLLLSITLVTLFKPFIKWSRKKTFLISFSLAIVLFIPSCTGVQIVIDKYRFGKFQYSNSNEIEDKGIKYSLPQNAKNITLYKLDTGHYAKYQISKSDLLRYINKLWEKEEISSEIKRRNIEGKSVDKSHLQSQFKNTDFLIENDAIQFNGVFHLNGAGSTYNYVPTKGIVYQRTSYW